MNKVLLVTGGSRGIGAATALLAAQSDWAIAVNYTANSLAADEVVRQIRASGGLPNRVKELQHLVPAQRGGTAEEVAQGIVWLLSDSASYTTMSFLDISGGR
ncbi:MAG: SDR family oxidoreductase [Burkholderiales bacterium]